jgi:hypothetical protein
LAQEAGGSKAQPPPTSSPRPSTQASDQDLIPPQLPKEQQQNLRRFLQEHQKPDRFVPPDAMLVDSSLPVSPEGRGDRGEGEAKPVKQYLVQIVSHRPVPGQEEPKLVDVVYYRPNPEKGKPGITVKHTVDLTTGKQVGATEVLVKRHTPISRQELAEAVELARENSDPVKALYKDRKNVHWEYLQLMINRKQESLEPGDRVVRLVFTAPSAGDQPQPEPVRVIVNLTKGVVVADPR